MGRGWKKDGILDRIERIYRIGRGWKSYCVTWMVVWARMSEEEAPAMT